MDIQLNTLIIPIYKNEANLPRLLETLRTFCTSFEHGIEVIFVVDGSPDNCYQILEKLLPNQPYKSQLIAHSRNFGSFAAIRTGMMAANGSFIAVMAADLQEPMTLITRFFEILATDQVDITLGIREGRADPFLTRFFAKIFWGIYRRVIQKDIPSGGVDIFGCNKQVCTIINSMTETHTSLIGLLFWVGFRRQFVPYQRLPRQEGKSAWSLWRKINYLMDSTYAFSALPITILGIIGASGMILCLIAALGLLLAYQSGWITQPGYTPIMLVNLFSLALTLFSQSLLGGYIWRSYEQTKQRPVTIIMKQHTFSGSLHE
jgi:glycosyltransferase involved in cell wall biosynthesis